MADPDKGTTKVSQSAIDEIKKMGMSKAIASYTGGGGSAEFRTAVERYYSPKRLSDASAATGKSTVSKPVTKATAKPADTGNVTTGTTTPKPPIKMPASVPAAATRKVEAKAPKKVDTGQTFGIGKAIGNWFTKGDKAAAAQQKARDAAKPPKPPPKPKTPAQIATKAQNEATYQRSRQDPQKMK